MLGFVDLNCWLKSERMRVQLERSILHFFSFLFLSCRGTFVIHSPRLYLNFKLKYTKTLNMTWVLHYRTHLSWMYVFIVLVIICKMMKLCSSFNCVSYTQCVTYVTVTTHIKKWLYPVMICKWDKGLMRPPFLKGIKMMQPNHLRYT